MKNKIIDVISDIVSKRQRNFTENFTVYILNTGKIGKVPEFKFDKFLEDHFLRWYKCNNYIVTTSALDFKQIYINYKFYPIKRIFLSEIIPYLAQIFNCPSQT